MPFYSPSTGGLYLDGMARPSDCREISAARHKDLIAAQALGQQILPDDEGFPLTMMVVQEITIETLCRQIDKQADSARLKLVGDPLRAAEYDRAFSEATAFIEAGCPDDAIPRTVSAWAILGRTHEEAALSIIGKAEDYRSALYLIRETRLQAKESIRMLMGKGEQQEAQQIAQAAVEAFALLGAEMVSE